MLVQKTCQVCIERGLKSCYILPAAANLKQCLPRANSTSHAAEAFTVQSKLCREVETFRSIPKTRASSFWWQRLHGCAHRSCVSVCLGPRPSLPADTGVCLVPLRRPQLSHSREWQKGEFDLSVLETAWLSAFPFLSALSEDAVTLPNYLESSVLEVFPMGCLW